MTKLALSYRCLPFSSAVFLLLLQPGAENVVAASEPLKQTIHRSPVSVALSPDRQFLAVANTGAGTVSRVNLRNRRVIRETSVGSSPTGITWLSARLLAVTVRDVHQVKLSGGIASQSAVQSLAIGEPAGITAVTVNGTKRIFVTSRSADEVIVLEQRGNGALAMVKRLTVGNRPSHLAVAPNGRWLVTCCELPGMIVVHDAHTLRELSRQRILGEAFNLGRPTFSPDSTWCILPYVANRTLPVSRDNIEKGWVVDNRLVRMRLPSGPNIEQQQMGLDPRGDAVGDAHAAALSPDGKYLVVSCGGTHELLVLRYKHIPWPAADPGDFIPNKLLRSGNFHRVKLGGRPLGLTFIDERRVAVANYFLDAVQLVDVEQHRIEQTIKLGPRPKSVSRARRGETIFYDADRSLNSWFSCHTCHTNGHTSGQRFDTLNDGNYDTYKLTPSLLGVTKTGPWTWHGWQRDLQEAMKKSLQTTLGTRRKVTNQDTRALVAFLQTLQHPAKPPQPNEKRLAAKRGKAVFRRAQCANCHSGKMFTTSESFDVGLGAKRYAYRLFNPPSLRGLYRRRRFLHDGRADSLREVLTQHHTPRKLTGVTLSGNELDDLIAFLKSL